MGPLTAITAVLLSYSMLATTAAAETHSQSSFCKQLEQRAEQCQGGTRLSNETRESCDQIEERFRAQCGPVETIGASASAGGRVLDLLRKDYRVEPIEKTAAGVFPTHVVIGPADLDDPHVIALMKRSYRVGRTVAIVGATTDQAGRFHRLLRPGERANCRSGVGKALIPLYGLQSSRYRAPSENSSYCLVDLDQRAAADRRWLRERFGPTPPQPAPGKVTTTDDSTTYLNTLATETHCDYKLDQGDAGIVEVELYTYAMRDFTDTGCSSCKTIGADYYLVQEGVTYSGGDSGMTYLIETGQVPVKEAASGLPLLSGLLDLEFADPQTTTTYESSYTNSTSVTASGSVGFNEDGPNVTAGGSVTTGQSTTYNVPATKILNQSNLATGQPVWEFTPQSLPADTDFSVNPTWTWYVPQDAYPSGGTGTGEIAFSASAFFVFNNSGSGEPGPACNVPFPFSAWTVNPPQLSSLKPTSTQTGGGQFTITGQYLYPGSVVAVLIGGNPVSLTNNVDLVNDTTIKVTVPGTFAPGTYKVQVNTQFNGQNMFSNDLDLTLTN